MALLQGCRGPVHGVVAEHWAVYTYWNTLERRPQVGPRFQALSPGQKQSCQAFLLSAHSSIFVQSVHLQRASTS